MTCSLEWLKCILSCQKLTISLISAIGENMTSKLNIAKIGENMTSKLNIATIGENMTSKLN